MPTIGWCFKVEESWHTVELDHGWYLGERKLRLDGQLLEHHKKVRYALLDRGSYHPFQIGKHHGGVSISSNIVGLFRYQLFIDDRSLPPSTAIPSQAPMLAAAIGVALAVGIAVSGIFLLVH
jgi:hypothetical protein